MFISYLLSLFVDHSPAIKAGDFFGRISPICIREFFKCLVELHCMIRGVGWCIRFGSADVLIQLFIRR